ncbi:MAG: HAD family hydrolase [Myxococcota bacterium]
MIDGLDAIFFDNDGVLVDTEPLFLRATQEILATVDVHFGEDEYAEICMRQGKSVFSIASERGISDAEILELRDVRDARYSDLIDAGVTVLDGVAETLGRLHGTLPLAIVTSSGKEHFARIHSQTELLPHFEFVLADGDYQNHKPHPEPYLAAAQRLDVDPARCLVIEDTERGLVAAAEAGMRCVVIPTGPSLGGDFRRAHARLNSMRELSALLAIEGKTT